MAEYEDLSDEAQDVIDAWEDRWESGATAGVDDWAEARDIIVENDALAEALAARLGLNAGDIKDELRGDGKWGERLSGVSQDEFESAIATAVEIHKWRDKYVRGITA